jgi:hypothetical protein
MLYVPLMLTFTENVTVFAEDMTRPKLYMPAMTGVEQVPGAPSKE